MSLWLDVTYESSRAAAWYAAQMIAAVLKQSSDGHARNHFPQNIYLQLSRKFSGTVDLLFKLNIFIWAFGRISGKEWFQEKRWDANAFGSRAAFPMATGLLLLGSAPGAGRCWVPGGGRMLHPGPTARPSALCRHAFAEGKQGGRENLTELLTGKKCIKNQSCQKRKW